MAENEHIKKMRKEGKSKREVSLIRKYPRLTSPPKIGPKPRRKKPK